MGFFADLVRPSPKMNATFWEQAVTDANLYGALKAACEQADYNFEKTSYELIDRYNNMREGYWHKVSKNFYDSAKQKNGDPRDFFAGFTENEPIPPWDKLQDKRVVDDQDKKMGDEGKIDKPPVLSTKNEWIELHQRNFRVLIALVWCAWQAWRVKFDKTESATSQPDFAAPDTPAIIRSLFESELKKRASSAQLPLLMQGIDPRYLCGWIRTFLGAKLHTPAVTVDIVNTSSNISYRISTLHLEVLQGGDGVFLHPADALRTRCDANFAGAVDLAWKSALIANRKRIEHENPAGELPEWETPLSGRFRVLQGGKSVAWEPKGNSAGGAAFRGWYHGLNGWVPDPETVVLASLKTNGSKEVVGLDEVNGLEKKVQAISQPEKKYDTIVVANPGQSAEVLSFLGEKKKSIQVVPPVIQNPSV